MRQEISGTWETVMLDLKSHGITPDMLNIVMELGNPEALEMAVERGVDLAFVSEMIAARGLAMGRIRRAELEGIDLHRTVYTARHVNLPLTRTQTLFWEFAQVQRARLNTDIWDNLVNFAETPHIAGP